MTVTNTSDVNIVVVFPQFTLTFPPNTETYISVDVMHHRTIKGRIQYLNGLSLYD